MATSIDIYSKSQVDTALGAKANFTTAGTAPSSPAQGSFWYDTANGVMKYYDGTNWQTLTTGSGTISWGAITGTLANQTDLQTALNGKQDALSTAQLAAANSGITAAKVTTYDGYAAQIAAKQDTVEVTDQGTYYTLTF